MKDLFDLSGKTALITGSTSGMGKVRILLWMVELRLVMEIRDWLLVYLLLVY